MFVTAIIGLITVLIGRKCSAEVTAGFCCDLRRVVFAKVNTMTFGEMSELGTAALVTRSTHDTETLGWISSMLSTSIISVPVLFIGGVFLSFRKDILLSSIVLVLVPIVFVVVVLIGRKIEPLWKISDSYIDKQNGIMRERLRGIRVIRAFDNEDKEHDKIADATRVMAENIINANVSMGVVAPLAMLVLNISVVLIVFADLERSSQRLFSHFIVSTPSANSSMSGRCPLPKRVVFVKGRLLTTICRFSLFESMNALIFDKSS